MARIGYLMLQGGSWDGRQIVSPEWVARSSTSHYPAPGYYGYGYQWWTLPVLDGYAATGHYEQKIYVLPGADMVVVFTGYIEDDEPHPTDALLFRYILRACTDLPTGTLMQHYERYGLSVDYPVEFTVLEAPIPGRDSLSEASGMVQFNLGFYPLEIINIVWEAAGADIDLARYPEEFVAGLAQQSGATYQFRGRSESEQADHPMVLRTFEGTAGGVRFAGATGAWHCPARERVYVVSYLTSPATSDAALLDALQDYTASVACD